MKKIGVSSYFLHPDPNRDVFWPKMIACFETQLCDFASLGESIAWPIIPFNNPKKIDLLFNQLDALVLQGGIDIHPQNYGQHNIDPTRFKNDSLRDAFEMKLIAKAIEFKIPILGICRGAQLLNVFFGGSLIQDVSGHRNREIYDQFTHTLNWDSQSFLSEIYPNANGQGIVNSIHHQCIDFIPSDLIACAFSHDSRVEAFKHKNLPIFGVQWHPEFTTSLPTPSVISGRDLWEWFLRQC